MMRGFAGGLIAFLSFGSIMMATRLDKVGEAAVLRETSTRLCRIDWLAGAKGNSWPTPHCTDGADRVRCRNS